MRSHCSFTTVSSCRRRSSDSPDSTPCSCVLSSVMYSVRGRRSLRYAACVSVTSFRRESLSAFRAFNAAICPCCPRWICASLLIWSSSRAPFCRCSSSMRSCRSSTLPEVCHEPSSACNACRLATCRCSSSSCRSAACSRSFRPSISLSYRSIFSTLDGEQGCAWRAVDSSSFAHSDEPSDDVSDPRRLDCCAISRCRLLFSARSNLISVSDSEHSCRAAANCSFSRFSAASFCWISTSFVATASSKVFTVIWTC
mmetsp:Transcript_27986/g.44916  ORF Transcript_27986/g.44916 Transcript_27986/m.44916 type:complete len:255 (-) Transcript_27986:385-1149(-)